MNIKGLRIGFALTASYCNFEAVIPYIEELVKKGAEVTPIMSYNAYTYDTRFGKAQDFIDRIEKITGKSILRTSVDVEPLGPKALIDVIVVMPCTGNTVAKIANGITDTSVTGAVKTMRRNDYPVVLGIATNDATALSMQNIGKLMSTEGIYLIPLRMDKPHKKPHSMICKWELLEETLELAMEGKQIKPELQ